MKEAPASRLGVRRRALAAAACAALAAGCGGGGGAGGGGTGGTPNPAPTPATVTVSGRVTFDLVPAVTGIGLDYAHTQVSPARGVTVELVSGSTVLGTTVTDEAGQYSFETSPNISVLLRARAEMLRSGSPSWDFRVVDNTTSDALYVLQGTAFDTGASDATRDLHAASGWDGSAYTETRSAAPFAILDVVHDAMQLVLATAPATTFPALRLHWSVNNVSTLGPNGLPDGIATGEIGNSFFAPGFGVFLLGAENDDTDEYDRHVIAHEWGHYFENSFSRSDSIGGSHALGDQVDMRVAFAEGWGNAFSAFATGDHVYRDVFGQGQAHGFSFDLEGASTFNSGWYGEASVQQLLYDLFDGEQDTVADVLSLGFAPLYSVLVNQQRTTDALTGVFPFIDALRDDRPGDAALIDNLAAQWGIGPAADAYGAGETNSGHPSNADVLPIYVSIAPGGGAKNVCSTDDFRSGVTGSTNKLGSRRFLKFAATVQGVYGFTATTTVMPSGESSDPDMLLHRRGETVATSGGAPSPACAPAAPAQCSESFSRLLTPGDYVLEVYEWTNTQTQGDEFPPIGRTGFDVEITGP